jgi:hypothetical protein
MRFKKKRETPVIQAEVVYEKGSMTMVATFEYIGRTIKDIHTSWDTDRKADRLVRIGTSTGVVIFPARAMVELKLTIGGGA